MSTEPVWYADGLRFACAACGRCCTGDPGYVWVGKEEMAPIAKALGMTEEDFCQKYLRTARGKLSLRERSNGDCMLLDESTRRCLVYEVRPVQCRTWPWWQENIESEEAWHARTSHCCGIGEGPCHSREKIDDAVAEDAAVNLDPTSWEDDDD